MYVSRNQTESATMQRIPYRLLVLLTLTVLLSVGCSSLQAPEGTLSPWGYRNASPAAPSKTTAAAYPETMTSSSADEGHLPATAPQRFEAGIASYYHAEQHGNKTASGEAYDHHKMTAAHPTLPFGTRVRVINQRNSQSVVVRVNDRGPHVPGRVIDLSGAAARRIDMIDTGVAAVELFIVEEPTTVAAQRQPEPPPAPQPQLPTYEAKGYAIQMGAFRDKDAAEQMAGRFNDGWVHTITVNDIPMHRVLYGRYDDEVSARKQRQTLKQQGHESFVKALN